MNNRKIRRGDIFYIAYKPTTGCEQRAGRPAIIVSNELNNRHSPTVEVVYLSASQRKDLPTHATIRSSPRVSTALCEQIHTVAKERVERWVGHITESEMAQVEICMMHSIALGYEPSANDPEPEIEEFNQEPPTYHEKEIADLRAKLDEAKMEIACMTANREKATMNATELIVRAETERDVYKRLYEELLAKIVK